MRLVFAMVLLAGFALAGFAAWKTAQFINASQSREQAALSQVVPTVEVLVVKKALPFGHVLTPEDVGSIAWPKAATPPTAFTDMKALFPEDKPHTRTVVRQLDQFEPILSTKVTEPGEDTGLNTRLNKGMRAFTVKVDATSGVSGFLRAGDRVDIYWTGAGAGTGPDSQGEITKLIESGITILATDQNDKLDTTTATIARTVTIELTPQQVGRMAQAQVTGRLTMALMGAADDTQAVASDVNKRDLLGIEPKPVSEPEARVCTVRTRKGADVVEIPIPCKD